MREEVHFFIFCLKLIKNLSLDVFDGSSFIPDKYLTVSFMGEHEQLNLNKFILKPHLSLKVEGEPPASHSIVSAPGNRWQDLVVFRDRPTQSPLQHHPQGCVTPGKVLHFSELCLLCHEELVRSCVDSM